MSSACPSSRNRNSVDDETTLQRFMISLGQLGPSLFSAMTLSMACQLSSVIGSFQSYKSARIRLMPHCRDVFFTCFKYGKASSIRDLASSLEAYQDKRSPFGMPAE